MASKKLDKSLLDKLRPLEYSLRHAVSSGDSDLAVEIAFEIQTLFGADRSHHRLLKSKLWAYEACLDAGKPALAESGAIGIRKLSEARTRLHLEATALWAVALLRQKKIIDAKDAIKSVLKGVNNIESDRTRHQFQKRFVERIEEECIFVELIGAGNEFLDAKSIEENAIIIIRSKTDDEIFKLIGDRMPTATIDLLNDVRSHALLQLPAPDRKLLPPPDTVKEPKSLGKTAFAALRRIAWKTFCKPSSPIFKLWSKRVPKVFNEGYFTAAAVSAFNDLKIGLPMLASGFVALVMKYSAEEFCELSKPKGIMISPADKTD